MPRKVQSSANSQNNGVQVNHRSTEPKKHYSQGVNYFDNSYTQAFSQRFADIHPFSVLDAIERDDIPFRSTHELGTYTLQSPLKSELYMHKTIALVPYQSILPNTWKLFYVNPTKGEDVPDDVYCNFDLFSQDNLNRLLKPYLDVLVDNSSTVSQKAHAIVDFFITLEPILSRGSLLTSLKLSLHSYWKYFMMAFKRFYESLGVTDWPTVSSFDEFFDDSFSDIFSKCRVSVGRKYGDDLLYQISNKDAVGVSSVVSPHLILDVLRERDYVTFFVDASSPEAQASINGLSQLLAGVLSSFLDNLDIIPHYNFSLERPIAYQLACCKFMTDDSIDNVYTANIFRNNFTALFEYGDMFSLNGQPIIYDVFSAHNLQKAFDSDPQLFISLLFTFRHSLKYGDYFISARPQPYALGDVNSPVVNNFVSAIDITRSISEQRFTNWSNRTGMSYEDYVEGLTGVRPSLDITEPLFVAHEQFQIFGMEVENTGEAQQQAGTNSVTTLLRSNVSKFLYNIGITDPCVLIGLSHFDVKRLYGRVMDRCNLKENRFDFFNKFYQYTGDQEIKSLELDAAAEPNRNFAYTTRYMQYKQQVSHAGGAFLGPLKSWAMVSDSDDDMHAFAKINSDFIRNTNSSFDVFYGSLSAYSLGNYFHFAVVYHNDFSNMRRAMDVAPDIL